MPHPESTFVRFTVLLFLVTAASVASADSFKTLLMPGPVIKAHEKYEQDCDHCHDTSDRERQAQLCVQCHAHENILEDLSNKSGYHGRLPESAQNDCKHCHTDHEGRKATVVLLDPSTFNHGETDFLLKGAHTKTACHQCHEPDKKYSQAPADCYGCHEKADVHHGKQGKKCDSCHSTSNWKKAEFDHDKTDFALKASHRDVGCSSCHLNQQYRDTPTDCYSCHLINDIHQGDFGKKCETCHNSKKWNTAAFDHDRKTDFPLSGRHKKAACNSCHDSGDTKKELPKQCYGCHKNDDSHKRRYGKKCADCHTSSSWQKLKFDHSRETDFLLAGKHKKLSCNHCHRGDLYHDKTGTQCIDCHGSDDIHKGRQGKQCDNCHNEKGWAHNVLFDHDLAKFPLIGMHAIAQCEECHLSTDFSDTAKDCYHCHADDDDHKTLLGTDCETCHNPNAWDMWLFDHNNTDFEIDGAHKELGCYDCHQTKSEGKLQAGKDCISCHRGEDIHNRQFGRQCGDCHSTKSFKHINIRQQW